MPQDGSKVGSEIPGIPDVRLTEGDGFGLLKPFMRQADSDQRDFNARQKATRRVVAQPNLRKDERVPGRGFGLTPAFRSFVGHAESCRGAAPQRPAARDGQPVPRASVQRHDQVEPERVERGTATQGIPSDRKIPGRVRHWAVGAHQPPCNESCARREGAFAESEAVASVTSTGARLVGAGAASAARVGVPPAVIATVTERSRATDCGPRASAMK